jgi:uncharacterized spore protein YtfJ
MIDYIVGGEYLNVTSNKGAQPYINMSSSQPMIGALSYDHNSQNMKVYDGNGWMTIGGGSATVNLNPNAINILKWAEQKMLEEAERNKLAETNPAIKDLMNQIKDKEEQLKMVMTLIKSPGNEPQELMGS